MAGERTEAEGSSTRHTAGGQGEAVCFAAGTSGAPFGAGVIHAYVAAGREPPEVVAGISMGALTAAAMSWTFQAPPASPGDADRTRAELRRQARLRQYVSVLSDNPNQVIWKALPGQSDFFVDLPPLEDKAVPGFLHAHEQRAVGHKERLIQLGRWLARLPVRVDSVARLAGSWVAWKEGRWPLWQFCWFALSRGIVLVGLAAFLQTLVHVVFQPLRPRRQEGEPGWKRGWLRAPLLGWRVYLAACVVLGLVSCIVLGGLAFVGLSLLGPVELPAVGRVSLPLAGAVRDWLMGLAPGWRALWSVVLVVAGGGAVALVLGLIALTVGLVLISSRRWSAPLLSDPGLERALVSDFELTWTLYRLFSEPETLLRDTKEKPPDAPTIDLTQRPRPLIVAAPLQTLSSRKPGEEGRPLVAYQLWARQGSLVDALRAALAVPGLFPPLHRDEGQCQDWLDAEHTPVAPEKMLDLVAGSAIRQNPLPALFDFLKRHPETAGLLSQTAERPGVHVVYSVPIETPPGREGVGLADEDANIVDVGVASLQLSKRLDTQLEVRQSNFISRLERIVRQAEPQPDPGAKVTLPIFVDEIAPELPLGCRNPLTPQREEVLGMVAQGCCRTLRRLYAAELTALAAEGGVAQGGHVPCKALLARVAAAHGGPAPTSPGLPEVCAHCTGLLSPPRTMEPPSRASPPTKNEGRVSEPTPTPSTEPWKPSIVFLASGGVFRGAFHIGMAAALTKQRIQPDLIVAASVGTLIGGALAKMMYNLRTDPSGNASTLDEPRSVSVMLEDLVELFLHVDERVALTRRLQQAVRELGNRLRLVNLSPNAVRRLLLRGGAADPAFILAGAPTALIEALANVFVIPPRQASDVVAEFLAGHVSRAAHAFALQLKGETLRRLGIFDALMGASLLEQQIRRLLTGQGVPLALDRLQPFESAGITFYSTSTDLGSQELQILGAPRPDGVNSFDFVEAGLASSAFPSVFAPRRASDVFPGVGRRDVRLADGGLFDNLPVFQALEVLTQQQRAWQQANPGVSSRAFLERRYQSPHLFLVGALNVNPEDTSFPGPRTPDVLDIRQRAGSLKDNVKIRAMESAAARIHAQVGRLLQAGGAGSWPGPEHDRFLHGIVDAAILPVFPADAAHLNGTFAFSPSTGLTEARVVRSIADGCFQTHRQLLRLSSSGPKVTDAHLSEKTYSTWEGFHDTGRIPRIGMRPPPRGDEPMPPGQRLASTQHPRQCPYFSSTGAPFLCPFTRSTQGEKGEMFKVWNACVGDAVHHEASGWPEASRRLASRRLRRPSSQQGQAASADRGTPGGTPSP